MKFYIYLLLFLFLLLSCEKESEGVVNFSKDYGSGLYISTASGVSFYKDQTVTNQIFKKVNGSDIGNVNKIKFKGTKAYVACDNSLFSANYETFEMKGEAGGFKGLVDFDFVYMDRIFAVDQDDSKVKVVDLDRMEVTSDIETGDSTYPVFILSKWYRSLVLNGGLAADSLKDSTVVAIDYKDELVPLNVMMGSLYIGDNPNSAVNINNTKILCKGIYDPNDLSNKTQSSLITIDPWLMIITDVQNLSGIYNGQNLISNDNDTEYYLTAEDGVYSMSNNGAGLNQITSMISNVLYYQDEEYSEYSTIDSVWYNYNRDVLYLNDAINNPNILYKYNLNTSAFIDTIAVSAAINNVIYK